MARRAVLTAFSVACAAVALSACNQAAPEPQVQETRLPEEFRQKRVATPAVAAEGVTPMNERVAVIGLLNKRNNLSRDLRMKPGESQRIGDVIVRVAACERTAPWEMPKETGAFVQVLVAQRGGDGQFAKIFSGWLFKNSPSLNVVEHPIYDVWVKDCTMAFPGEEGTPDSGAAERPARPAPRASASPAPAAPATAPSASPTPQENETTA